MFRCALSLSLVCAGLCTMARADDKAPPMPKPTAEHQFFKNFAGEWDCEMQEHGKKDKHKGTMTGTMIGDFWANVVIKSEMDGMPFVGQGTFGYDSKKKKAVGTWVCSMDEVLWTYDGKIEGKKVVFDAKGPSMMEPNKLVDYRDTRDFSTPGKLVLTTEMAMPDGKMVEIMKSTCVRKK